MTEAENHAAGCVLAAPVLRERGEPHAQTPSRRNNLIGGFLAEQHRVQATSDGGEQLRARKVAEVRIYEVAAAAIGAAHGAGVATQRAASEIACQRGLRDEADRLAGKFAYRA